ncbi:MAG: DNA adenine methylase [Armatimonadetes bacterium]|nr:DNA adenine methylase [Armatimonadota bacterium]
MAESVFQYPGGKARIAGWIADHLPPPGSFNVFVDAFGGSGSVLLEVMRRCEHAGKKALFVLNDLDNEIVNFFRVLRDPELRQKLQEALTWTPYARTEYMACLEASPTDDPVEKARRFFVLRQQSYGGHGASKGQWQYHLAEGWRKSGPQRWLSSREKLERFGMAFQKVQVECLDFADLIRRYDRGNALLYLDPPYYPDTRKDNHLYRLEMTKEQHRELAEILNSIKGMAALSGYRCPEYDEWYSGWERHDLNVICHLSSVGGEKYRGEHPGRVESLWLNPAAVQAGKGKVEQLMLFDDWEEAAR